MSIHTNEYIIELSQDLRKANDHIVDSINLLVFTFLLVLVILTVWLFKHKKFSYIHETGLAIIYGSIFGLIIQYGFKSPDTKSVSLTANNLTIDELPDFIYLNLPNHTQEVICLFYAVFCCNQPLNLSLTSKGVCVCLQKPQAKDGFHR